MRRHQWNMRLIHTLRATTAVIAVLSTFTSTYAAASGAEGRYIDAVTLAPPVSQALANLGSRTPETVAPKGAPPYVCPSGIPRGEADRPDRQSGRQVHVVYLVAEDFPDERLDTKGVLNCSVRAWSKWFVEQTGGLEWRIDTFKPRSGKTSEVVDITFVPASVPGAELSTTASVEAELQRAGLVDPQKLYLAYVAADGGGTCGRGRYPLASTGDGGVFGGHGRFAYAYLFGAEGCHGHDFGVPGSPRWIEATVMQEMLHSEGVVPLGAPHACTGIDPMPNHLCTPGLGLTELAGVGLDPERVDVMFPFVSVPLSEKVLDRDHDDYFAHSLPLRDLGDSPYLVKR